MNCPSLQKAKEKEKASQSPLGIALVEDLQVFRPFKALDSSPTPNRDFDEYSLFLQIIHQRVRNSDYRGSIVEKMSCEQAAIKSYRKRRLRWPSIRIRVILVGITGETTAFYRCNSHFLSVSLKAMIYDRLHGFNIYFRSRITAASSPRVEEWRKCFSQQCWNDETHALKCSPQKPM